MSEDVWITLLFVLLYLLIRNFVCIWNLTLLVMFYFQTRLSRLEPTGLRTYSPC